MSSSDSSSQMQHRSSQTEGTTTHSMLPQCNQRSMKPFQGWQMSVLSHLAGGTEARSLPGSSGLGLREIEASGRALDGQGSLVVFPGCLLSRIKGAKPQAHILGGVPDLSSVLSPGPQPDSTVPESAAISCHCVPKSLIMMSLLNVCAGDCSLVGLANWAWLTFCVSSKCMQQEVQTCH